jgi:hypothetical protein
MSGLVPAIHVFLACWNVSKTDVDGRDKPGHDEEFWISLSGYSAAARFDPECAETM